MAMTDERKQAIRALLTPEAYDGYWAEEDKFLFAELMLTAKGAPFENAGWDAAADRQLSEAIDYLEDLLHCTATEAEVRAQA